MEALAGMGGRVHGFTLGEVVDGLLLLTTPSVDVNVSPEKFRSYCSQHFRHLAHEVGVLENGFASAFTSLVDVCHPPAPSRLYSTVPQWYRGFFVNTLLGYKRGY